MRLEHYGWPGAEQLADTGNSQPTPLAAAGAGNGMADAGPWMQLALPVSCTTLLLCGCCTLASGCVNTLRWQISQLSFG
jgi:hypothetical protein